MFANYRLMRVSVRCRQPLSLESLRFQKVRRKWVTRSARDGKQQHLKRALVVGLG